MAWFLLVAFACDMTMPVRTLPYVNERMANITMRGGLALSDGKPVTAIVFSLSEKGDTISVVPYLHGKHHGIAREYHANGRLKSIRFAENGWKQGTHRGWFENGNKQFEFHFRDDVFHGNQREWMPHGVLYSDLNYDYGVPSGHQKVWDPNGRIKTNYVIINNRRYGLLGTKNCVNISDSVFVGR
ncbi:MAG TPA: toxin-antitoxin system YwqK family antitoxin [Chryseosolibacter sp.]|nr:toxin-antitoxin system YwqK family antitoxin [Chryseosolibacter sp.]